MNNLNSYQYKSKMYVVYIIRIFFTSVLYLMFEYDLLTESRSTNSIIFVSDTDIFNGRSLSVSMTN